MAWGEFWRLLAQTSIVVGLFLAALVLVGWLVGRVLDGKI